MSKLSGGNVDKILYLLKTRGELTTKALAAELDLTTMGARQHLLHLREQGLIESCERVEKVGRPSQYWRLLPKADERFPDAHSGLACSVINAAMDVFGKDGLALVLAQRQQNLCDDYRRELDALDGLPRKLTKLAELRNAEGYLAEWHAEGDDCFHFYENHCPIREAADSCGALCGNELALFRSCLGDGVSIERVEHMLDGCRRCAYQIRVLAQQ